MEFPGRPQFRWWREAPAWARGTRPCGFDARTDDATSDIGTSGQKADGAGHPAADGEALEEAVLRSLQIGMKRLRTELPGELDRPILRQRVSFSAFVSLSDSKSSG
jgi:hypothetical protein